MVSEWFPNYLKVQSLFLSIKDFESGCRNFLNHFNEGLGNQQLVYSHEILSCVVENQTLQKPGGINEFWVDFNMKLKTISFYYVNQDSEVWQLLTLSKDHVKRVRTEYDGGKLNVLISCDSSLNDGVKLVFLHPKNIPELLKVLFGKELAEPAARPNGIIKKISKSAGTLLIDMAQVQAKKKARRSVPVVSNFVSDPKQNSSQEISDLPCAQPPRSSSELNDSLMEEQVTDQKVPKKISLSKPKNFFNRYRPFSGKKAKAVKSELIASALSVERKAADKNGNESSLDIGPKKIVSITKPKSMVDCKTGSKLPAGPIKVVEGEVTKVSGRNDDLCSYYEMKKAENEDSKRNNGKKGDSVVSKKKPNCGPKRKDKNDTSNNVEGSSVFNNKSEAKQSKINDLLSDWDEVVDSDSLVSKAQKSNVNFNGAEEVEGAANKSVEEKRSRLSYSGRRVRAQRKATKRKQDAEQPLPVKKRICFDEEEDGNDASRPQCEEKNIDTAASILSDNQNNEEVKPPTPIKENNDEVKFPTPIKENYGAGRLPTPEAGSEVLFKSAAEENDSIKGVLISKSKPAGSAVKEKTIKPRKSKVLFSGFGSMLMDGDSGIEEQEQQKAIKKIAPVSYDDIYGKPKSGFPALKADNKSSTKKPKPSIKLDVSPAKTKPRRSYIRKKTPVATTNNRRKTLDPYSLSITPKKGPKSTTKSIQKKKPATRRSTKIFSDDSIVDSVKKTPVKNLSPYPSLKIEDAGDKSLDPTFKPEKATRQQREIRKKALNFLEHVSGLLNAAAEFDDRVTRSVFRDIAFYIEEKTDDLVR